MPTTRQGPSSAAIEKLIAQRVAEAMAAYEANQNNQNGNGNPKVIAEGDVPVSRFEKLKPRLILDTDLNGFED
ncbi:hypothetical protein Tco_1083853 [Tanacetum coccineum]